MLSFNGDERSYLRELARQLAEIAQSPENAACLRRWCDVNALRKPDRTPVWCRPVDAWAELLPEDSLHCRNPWLRGIERGLRQDLIKHEIGDDTPFFPTFPVDAVFHWDPPNIFGVDIAKHESNMQGGAWGYDPPLITAGDFDKLRVPCYICDHAATQRALAQADELLGDILPVRLRCMPPMIATLGWYAADLRGLSQMMLDMVDAPELVHRLMAFLRDCVLQTMDDVEASALLTVNNDVGMIYSEPIGGPLPDGRLTLKNLWCMGNSQEFDQVSPAMWEEFLLQYQMPIFARHGLSAYGCCENLTHKIDGVLTIPNLRIFVCSAWTNLDRVIEKVADRHVIMWRQKASDVVFTEDETDLSKALNDGMCRLQGCYSQIVLRELQTLAGHHDRLHVWTRLAKEAATRYA